MKYAKYSALLLCILFAATSVAQRMKYNFNPGWKVFAGDAKGADGPPLMMPSWKGVTVPYAWNEDEAFKKDIADLSTGIAWYRKHFKLPASAKGQKIFFGI